MGRFMLVFRGEYSPTECLNLYRDKYQVEKAFEILKTDLDIFLLREGTKKQKDILEALQSVTST